jgi:hypothetical protein
MTINTERAILKGLLAELKMNRMDLVVSIGANLKAVRNTLAAANIRPVAEIDIGAALIHLKEAALNQKELVEVDAKIAAAERDLA